SARAALARGDLPEARRVVNVNRGMKSDDPAWSAVAKDLDAAEGRQSLREAQEAFQRGNIDYAGTAAVKAKALIPDDPELAKLLAAIEKREGDQKNRERVLQEADNLITENQPAKAEELLQKLAAQFADDAAVANALRRAKAAREKAEALDKAVREQLEQGASALARADLDAAQLAYTAARQLDPKNEAATQGLNLVRERKEAVEAARKRIDAALAAKDLAKAEIELAALEKLAPGSSQAVLAGSQVAAAKVAQAEARAKAEALERQRQDRARELAAVLDDLAKPIEPAAAAVEAFAAEAGADRAELPDLRRRVDDRRSRDAVVALIAGIETAFAARTAEPIRAAYVRPDDAVNLLDFMAMPGARIKARLSSFTRNGETAAAAVELAHAMDEAPEEKLAIRWELRREAGAWRIAGARIETTEGSR
ncbi:MAG: hypothetical protein J0M02_15665, partial [Planctomycetes bacterium]|nr:hypothetical protein [Planctomycetota bacterium]